MQVFVRVVQEGSFSAAARYLDVTPSAVSRKISELERELSGRLFQRTTRRQSLTEAGEIYYQHVQHIVEDIETARTAVNQLTATPFGSLSITAEADFANVFLTPILAEFLSQYPDVNLRMKLSTHQLDLVHDGIDLAIRVGHLEDSSLFARQIALSRSLVCASPAYLKKNGTPMHPSELATHSCLSFQIGLGKHSWSFQSPQGVVDVPISGRLKVNGLGVLRSTALAGLGIILIPTWMMQEELKKKQLIPILEDFPLLPSSTPIHAVFAHNRNLAPKVRVFIDFLVERIDLV